MCAPGPGSLVMYGREVVTGGVGGQRSRCLFRQNSELGTQVLLSKYLIVYRERVGYEGGGSAKDRKVFRGFFAAFFRERYVAFCWAT